ncbi:HVO_A0114 family putative DNA-binding protein [Paraburkholderia caledonica]|uniref:HVO_A0114 family putative DNA-binding protein n=1 Tax=Paraburkholderia caledonica TaxID=134536 RepID=UPI0038BCD2EC
MRTVTLGVASRDPFSARVVSALKGEPQGEHVTFESIDLLLATLTPNRLAILKLLTSGGPQTLHALARLAGRDLRAIRRDVRALLDVGVLDRQADGIIVFPYDNVQVKFTLK